ncbi:hypothetical protein XENTR_v10020667 [Xenopus tropicalis]|nr:hypothetical protein XENTR_v10020667 [Xenopus tropicalis]
MTHLRTQTPHLSTHSHTTTYIRTNITYTQIHSYLSTPTYISTLTQVDIPIIRTQIPTHTHNMNLEEYNGSLSVLPLLLPRWQKTEALNDSKHASFHF